MKNLIIKIAVGIVVVLSSFSIQSCQKAETKITPVQTPPPAPVDKNTFIGKWRAVKGTTTIEREFIKGANATAGTGNDKASTLTTSNIVTVITSTFKWELKSTSIMHFQIVADEFFFFKIIDNGNRLLLFDDVHTDRLLFTFERIN